MTRYSKISITLHWFTALVILACWLLSEGGPRVRTEPPVLHMALGLSVLVLVGARLLARLVQGTPAPVPSSRPLEAVAERLGHLALYALMSALPLSGWYAASRLGLPLSFGPLTLPQMTSPVTGPPGIIAELHENGGTELIWLAGLHGLIALWHQFVRRDGTLSRMIPMQNQTLELVQSKATGGRESNE